MLTRLKNKYLANKALKKASWFVLLYLLGLLLVGGAMWLSHLLVSVLA